MKEGRKREKLKTGNDGNKTKETVLTGEIDR